MRIPKCNPISGKHRAAKALYDDLAKCLSTDSTAREWRSKMAGSKQVFSERFQKGYALLQRELGCLPPLPKECSESNEAPLPQAMRTCPLPVPNNLD